MQPDHLIRAADLSEQAYHPKKIKSLQPDFWRSVNLYSISNSCLVFVKVDEASSRAYVVFRGTIPGAGNWLFANLQTHKTRYESPAFPRIGTVQMGYYRAFHWLWRKSEPAVPADHEASRKRIFWIRHSLIALGLGALMAAVFVFHQSLSWKMIFGSGIAIGLALPLWIFLVPFELGLTEAGFKIPEPEIREEGTLDVAALYRYEEVIFTGHSLGGALAAIAFAVYDEQAGGKSNAVLVTFGAPSIGDRKCVRDLERQHHARMLHVARKGDLVPHVPCNLWQAAGLLFRYGALYPLLLVFIGVMRPFYALAYWQGPPGKWKKRVEIGDGPLHYVRHHSMVGYLDLVQKDAVANEHLPPQPVL